MSSPSHANPHEQQQQQQHQQQNKLSHEGSKSTAAVSASAAQSEAKPKSKTTPKLSGTTTIPKLSSPPLVKRTQSETAAFMEESTIKTELASHSEPLVIAPSAPQSIPSTSRVSPPSGGPISLAIDTSQCKREIAIPKKSVILSVDGLLSPKAKLEQQLQQAREEAKRADDSDEKKQKELMQRDIATLLPPSAFKPCQGGQIALTPIQEEARIKSLHAYNILDAAQERAFDDLVLLASQICEMPVSMLSFVDARRQFFMASIGAHLKDTPRDASFCSHAILQPEEVMQVPDTAADERFADHPLVVGGPKIGAYFGAPIVDASGLALGTLCVISTVPKQLTPMQLQALKVLSRQITNQLDLRRFRQEFAQHAAATALVQSQHQSAIQQHQNLSADLSLLRQQHQQHYLTKHTQRQARQLSDNHQQQNQTAHQHQMSHHHDQADRSVSEGSNDAASGSFQTNHASPQQYQNRDNQQDVGDMYMGPDSVLTTAQLLSRALSVERMKHGAVPLCPPTSARQYSQQQQTATASALQHQHDRTHNRLAEPCSSGGQNQSGQRTRAQESPVSQSSTSKRAQGSESTNSNDSCTMSNFNSSSPSASSHHPHSQSQSHSVPHPPTMTHRNSLGLDSNATTTGTGTSQTRSIAGTTAPQSLSGSQPSSAERDVHQHQHHHHPHHKPTASMDSSSLTCLPKVDSVFGSIVRRKSITIVPALASATNLPQTHNYAQTHRIESRDEGEFSPVKQAAKEKSRPAVVRHSPARGGTHSQSNSRSRRTASPVHMSVTAPNGAQSGAIKIDVLAETCHELRAPISCVLGVTALLANTPLNSEQRDLVQTVQSSGLHLITVLNDILDYAKSENGSFELEYMPCSLLDCIEQSIQLSFRPKSTETIDLLYSIDPAVPPIVMGDAVRIKQVLINLLSNASKFTQRGQIEITVSLVHKDLQQDANTSRQSASGASSARESKDTTAARRRPNAQNSASAAAAAAAAASHESQTANSFTKSHHDREIPPPLDSSYLPNSNHSLLPPSAGSQSDPNLPPSPIELQISIKDSGPGIPPSKMIKLFRAFSQVDSSIARLHGGTGLGLALCASLVQLMHGRIYAESSEGNGAAFVFTLPTRAATGADLVHAAKNLDARSPVQSPALQAAQRLQRLSASTNMPNHMASNSNIGSAPSASAGINAAAAVPQMTLLRRLPSSHSLQYDGTGARMPLSSPKSAGNSSSRASGGATPISQTPHGLVRSLTSSNNNNITSNNSTAIGGTTNNAVPSSHATTSTVTSATATSDANSGLNSTALNARRSQSNITSTQALNAAPMLRNTSVDSVNNANSNSLTSGFAQSPRKLRLGISQTPAIGKRTLAGSTVVASANAAAAAQQQQQAQRRSAMHVSPLPLPMHASQQSVASASTSRASLPSSGSTPAGLNSTFLSNSANTSSHSPRTALPIRSNSISQSNLTQQQQQHQQHQQQLQNISLSLGATPPSYNRHQLPSLILIIEPNTALAQQLSDTIVTWQMQAICFKNTRECLSHIRTSMYDETRSIAALLVTHVVVLPQMSHVPLCNSYEDGITHEVDSGYASAPSMAPTAPSEPDLTTIQFIQTYRKLNSSTPIVVFLPCASSAVLSLAPHLVPNLEPAASPAGGIVEPMDPFSPMGVARSPAHDFATQIRLQFPYALQLMRKPILYSKLFSILDSLINSSASANLARQFNSSIDFDASSATSSPGISSQELTPGGMHHSLAAPAPLKQIGQTYPLRILIAEDDLISAKIASKMLTAIGYGPLSKSAQAQALAQAASQNSQHDQLQQSCVAHASDGETAFKLCTQRHFDLILCDMHLPRLDGCSFTRKLLAHYKQRNAQAKTDPQIEYLHPPNFVAMTASSQLSDKKLCLDAGMNAFCSKPISFQQLEDICESTGRAMQKQKARQASELEPNSASEFSLPPVDSAK